ncbi:MAG: glycosyltransferase family 39 protein [Verrucomicrobia bacterium]|nr:glycosyltransferase family 39 protein [Verrucomicrobiota bacterium]
MMKKAGISIETVVVALSLIASLVIILSHMTGPLSAPSWRPSTTAYMAYRMAQESPPDILHPKVVYRGPREVRVSEFPLYPFVVSLVYKAMSVKESLPAARAVTLLFFLGSAYFLHRTMSLLFSKRAAWYAVCVYALMPLNLFYSRSLHYDVALMFCSTGFFYYGLRYCDTKSWLHFGASTVLCAAAFLMKAPYCYFYGFGLLAYLFYTRVNRNLKNLFLLGCLFIFPLLVAVLFNLHRIQIEGSEPQSVLMPQKWTGGSQLSWFFGDLMSRLDPAHWYMFVQRTVLSVLTPAGVVAAFAALVLPGFFRRKQGAVTTWALGFGVFTYVLLVFPMIASTHDYYSLPLTFYGAMLIGVCLEWMSGIGKRLHNAVGPVCAALFLAALWAGSASGLQRGAMLVGNPYFKVDWQFTEAGRIIGEHTAEDECTLVTTMGRTLGETDPRVLYAAKRRGWGRGGARMNAEILATYISGGADYCALIMTTEYDPETDRYNFLQGYPHETYPMTSPDGEHVGSVILYDLRAD